MALAIGTRSGTRPRRSELKNSMDGIFSISPIIA
jgi:hypothetical protein